MESILYLVISGVVGVGTFFLISRKFGSDCIP